VATPPFLGLQHLTIIVEESWGERGPFGRTVSDRRDRV